jgi:hypothetical protein
VYVKKEGVVCWLYRESKASEDEYTEERCCFDANTIRSQKRVCKKERRWGDIGKWYKVCKDKKRDPTRTKGGKR